MGATMAGRLLRIRGVLERTGLSKTSMYRQIGEGDFPRPIQLTENTVAWREREVDEWIESRETVPPFVGSA